MRKQARSTLPRLETGIGLANNVKPTTTAYDFAVGMPVFQGLYGGGYLHFKQSESNIRSAFQSSPEPNADIQHPNATSFQLALSLIILNYFWPL